MKQKILFVALICALILTGCMIEEQGIIKNEVDLDDVYTLEFLNKLY